MTSQILELILRLRKQGNAPKEVKDDLKGIQDEVRKAALGLTTYANANEDAAGALKQFGVDLTALSNPLTFTAGLVKESIGLAAEWGDSMGDLAQVTGATVEQTSLMAASFELVGVNIGTIESAMKAMTKNGLAPNLETMKDLAKQYQAIQDPIKQNEFLFKIFGRSGLEMAEIMGKSADELERLEAAARASGKVIGDETAEAAEELNLQLAILNQKAEGAKIAIGGALVPILNEAAVGGDNLAKVISALAIKTQLATGSIDAQQAALRAQALAAGDLMAHMKDFEPVYEQVSEAQKIAAMETRGLVKAFGEIPPPADLAYQANALYLSSLDGIIGASSDLKFSMSEVTKEMIFQAASAGMPAEAALELARAMGLVDEQALSTKQTLDELRVKYDTNKDGAISTAEAARGYTRDVAALGSAVERLPRDTTINVTTVLTEVRRQAAEEFRAQVGSGRQGGGPVYAGGVYPVGEAGMEIFRPASNGTIIPNHELGGVTVNIGTINAGQGANGAKIVDEIERELARRARARRNAAIRIEQ